MVGGSSGEDGCEELNIVWVVLVYSENITSITWSIQVLSLYYYQFHVFKYCHEGSGMQLGHVMEIGIVDGTYIS